MPPPPASRLTPQQVVAELRRLRMERREAQRRVDALDRQIDDMLGLGFKRQAGTLSVEEFLATVRGRG